jgi:hypothetical protein
MRVKADPRNLAGIDQRIQVLRDFGGRELVVTLPRWGAFTEIVPKMALAGVEFVEISGNDDIMVSATAALDASPEGLPMKLLFPSTVMSPDNRKRLVFVAKVANLALALREIPKAQMKLEHIYDF